MKVRSSIKWLVALTAIGALGGCAGWTYSGCISSHGVKICGSASKKKAIGLSPATTPLGISQRVLNSPYGTAAKVTVSAASLHAPTADMVNMMVQSFDPSELTVRVNVQGGHLAGATGIAQMKVLNAAGKVLATKDAAYAINGNTLYLQNPGALKNWLMTHKSALVKEGASGIHVSANLPLIRNPSTPSVHVVTTINYNGTLIGSVTGNFRGLHLHSNCPHSGTIGGVHCRTQ